MEHLHEGEVIFIILIIIVIGYRLITSGTTEWVYSLISAFNSNQQAFITVTTTIIFSGCILLAFFHDFPNGAEKVLMVLIGNVSAKWGDLVAYYFGSSQGSAKKTDILAAQSPIPTIPKE